MMTSLRHTYGRAISSGWGLLALILLGAWLLWSLGFWLDSSTWKSAVFRWVFLGIPAFFVSAIICYSCYCFIKGDEAEEDAEDYATSWPTE